MLGVLYESDGQHARSLQHQEQCLAIQHQWLDPEDRECALTLSNIALSLDGLGEFDAALERYREALAIFLPFNDQELPNVYMGMANVFHRSSNGIGTRRRRRRRRR